MKAEIPLGEWLPDQPAYQNAGLVLCRNVFASAGGYRPIPAPVAQDFGDYEANGTILAIKRFDLPHGDPIIVFATSSPNCLCFLYNGAIKEQAIDLDGGDGEMKKPEFAMFNGAIFCITHGNAKSLYVLDTADDFTTDSDWRVSDTGDKEANADDIANPAPHAEHIGVISNFLVLGNLHATEDGARKEYPTTLQWSAQGNANQPWITDTGRLSGISQPLPYQYGAITGLVDNRLPIVFQERAIHRINFLGELGFGFQLLSGATGCAASDSIVYGKEYVYFLSDDGFCRTDGSSISRISTQRVWRYFTDNLREGRTLFVQGAVDYQSESIIWNYDVAEGQKAQLIYNYTLDRWTHSNIQADWFFEGVPTTITMDMTDKSLGQAPDGSYLDDNMDAQALDGEDLPSLDDSRYESGTQRILSCYINPKGSVAGSWNNMKGHNLEAFFETGDFTATAFFKSADLPQGSVSFITEIRPHVDTKNPVVWARIGGRDSLGQEKRKNPVAGATQGSHGYIPVVSEGRYVSVEMGVPEMADWKYATGFTVSFRLAGVI